MMRVVIRADASLLIGTGHIMRCLSLAGQLRLRRHEVIFVCRDHQGNMIDFIRGKGYEVLVLHGINHQDVREGMYSDWLGSDWCTDAQQTIDHLEQLNHVDWLVVDHYAVDWRWEAEIVSCRPSVKLFVIDDLANRQHNCSILLDQNLSVDLSTKYKGLLPNSTIVFLGPSYALLRDEFVDLWGKVAIREGVIHNITVFYGGNDITGETLKAISALSRLPLKNISINVIVGVNNSHRLKIQEICQQLEQFSMIEHVADMAELMNKTDLFIGAGGSTTWERCMLGVPSITTVVADNQKEITEAVEMYGATWNLGEHSKVTELTIQRAVHYAINHPTEVQNMSKQCLAVIGEYQGPNAIIDKMVTLNRGSNS